MECCSPPRIAELHARLRSRRPLVQNITNFVAMTLSANVLLAAGASAAMVHAAEEVEDLAAIGDALVINIGTLSPSWIAAMEVAAGRYRKLGKPWLLDPVGVGATRLRTSTAAALIALGPTAIRANAGEVLALTGMVGAVRGVESLAAAHAALEAAMNVAARSGAVVAVTGETDYVTDGRRVVEISGGDPLMPLSTAVGCALSALAGAFLVVAPPFEAMVAALTVYAAAGRIAARKLSGPGYLPAELCDALFNLDVAGLAANACAKPLETAKVS